MLCKKAQLEAEISSEYHWDVFQSSWRSLQQQRCLSSFQSVLSSTRFTQPQDRSNLLKTFDGKFNFNERNRNSIVEALLSLTVTDLLPSRVKLLQKDLFDSLTSEKVEAQTLCLQLSECHASLLQDFQSVVEEFRYAMHFYGALQSKPPLSALLTDIQSLLLDTNLIDLFRLAGNLKKNLESTCKILSGRDALYTVPVQESMHALLFITQSFSFEALFESKGRLGQLERLRNLLLKLRAAKRNALPSIISSLVVELEEVVALFTAEELANELREMLLKVIKEIKEAVACVDFIASASSFGGAAKTLTTGSSTMLFSDEEGGGGGFDPLQVRNWSKQLGIFLFASQLPNVYQLQLLKVLGALENQLKCIDAVDKVINHEAEHVKAALTLRSKKNVSELEAYLASNLANKTIFLRNLSAFYLQLAEALEKYEIQMGVLKEKTKDESWDIQENHRITCDELEEEYQRKCHDIESCADVNVIPVITSFF